MTSLLPAGPIDSARRELCLLGAEQLSRRLARDAVWDGDCCTWIGADWDPDTPQGLISYYVATASLHSGTAGIGWFLAREFARQGDPLIGEAARGALRHASRHWSELEPRLGGLHGGLGGVAIGLVAGCIHLKDDEFREGAAALLHQLCSRRPVVPSSDLITGVAGTVVSLLHGWRLTECGALLDAACDYGAELLRRADRAECGLSWRSPSEFGVPGRNLTGLSHGASGIAWALAELYGVTGDDRWRSAALDGFKYEAHYFESEKLNWPDFRYPSADSGPRFAVAWCHGSPGMILARARCAQLLGAAHLATEATRAVPSVIEALADRAAGSTDQSLCHGTMGRVAALLSVGAAGVAVPGDAEITRTLDFALLCHVRRSVPWPSGATNGYACPGLMTGNAGIGHTLLRMAAPSNDLDPLLPEPSGSAADPQRH